MTTHDDHRPLSDDRTIPARSASRERPRLEVPIESLPPDAKPLPWLLELYYRAETDVNKELVARFPHMPVMSLIHFRTLGDRMKLYSATISTQDGAASLTVDVDGNSKAVCFTYTLSSMLALRFSLAGLQDKDRAQWLYEMRTERGEIAFLWDQTRWGSDYLIGVSFKNFTNLFAFSPHHVEAGVRLTHEVTHKLLDWLHGFWKLDAASTDGTPSAQPW
ncbi:MAG: hypothetical protein J0M07_22395 [Anaerolineae bacterium]|mgnify:FL=1|nr:hypothetical protein [Anaerolineae bacterium]